MGRRGKKPPIEAAENALTNVPPPPDWFSTEAAEEWRRVMPVLIERQTLTDGDWSTVESYCVAVGQIRQAEQVLQEIDEQYYVASNGSIRPHPAFATMKNAMGESRRFANELGLTPAARKKGENPNAAGLPAGSHWDDDLIDG